MTKPLDEQEAEQQHRVRVLRGILNDLPQTSESTEVVLDEIQQARVRADYLGRLRREQDLTREDR